MRYKCIFIFVLLICFSCGKQDPNEQIQYLGGYWSVEKVQLPDGTEKEFSISTTIDFIEVNEMNGLRKKVQPKLDGTFLTNAVVETFEIKIEDDSLRLYYSTPYDSWKETVLEAKDSLLVVFNKDHKMYHYKKFEKFQF